MFLIQVNGLNGLIGVGNEIISISPDGCVPHRGIGVSPQVLISVTVIGPVVVEPGCRSVNKKALALVRPAM